MGFHPPSSGVVPNFSNFAPFFCQHIQGTKQLSQRSLPTPDITQLEHSPHTKYLRIIYVPISQTKHTIAFNLPSFTTDVLTKTHSKTASWIFCEPVWYFFLITSSKKNLLDSNSPLPLPQRALLTKERLRVPNLLSLCLCKQLSYLPNGFSSLSCHLPKEYPFLSSPI